MTAFYYNYKVTPNTHKLCTNCYELVDIKQPEPCPLCHESSGKDQLYTTAWCPDCDEPLDELEHVEIYMQYVISRLMIDDEGRAHLEGHYTEQDDTETPDELRYECPYCHTFLTDQEDEAEMILKGDWSWYKWN